MNRGYECRECDFHHEVGYVCRKYINDGSFAKSIYDKTFGRMSFDDMGTIKFEHYENIHIQAVPGFDDRSASEIILLINSNNDIEMKYENIISWNPPEKLQEAVVKYIEVIRRALTNHMVVMRAMNKSININSKVITKSNEPDGFRVGKLIEFKIFGKDKSLMPVVEYSNEDKLCVGGAINLYTVDLENKLKKLKPIEQWNYLTPNHCQIKEKYGIKYKTFH